MNFNGHLYIIKARGEEKKNAWYGLRIYLVSPLCNGTMKSELYGCMLH